MEIVLALKLSDMYSVMKACSMWDQKIILHIRNKYTIKILLKKSIVKRYLMHIEIMTILELLFAITEEDFKHPSNKNVSFQQDGFVQEEWADI